MAGRRSSAVISSSATNFSRMPSSMVLTASMISARRISASSTNSGGTSTSSQVAPRSEVFQTRPRMVSRSTTPAKSDSAPIGICSTSGLQSSRSRMLPVQNKKSAPVRSSLLTKQMRGTP